VTGVNELVIMNPHDFPFQKEAETLSGPDENPTQYAVIALLIIER
jgi:hypothetical protein